MVHTDDKDFHHLECVTVGHYRRCLSASDIRDEKHRAGVRAFGRNDARAIVAIDVHAQPDNSYRRFGRWTVCPALPWSGRRRANLSFGAPTRILSHLGPIFFPKGADSSRGSLAHAVGRHPDPSEGGSRSRRRAANPGGSRGHCVDCGADLIVMGAYGQSRMHELVFGSCTEAFLRDADRPILLMH